MPINYTINISKSVGSGGYNQLEDVMAVQRQINGQMNPPRVWLDVDGKAGKKTSAAIRDFQRSVLGFKSPDGRVDPGGKTLMALNDPASEGTWAGMSMMPEPTVQDVKPGVPSSDGKVPHMGNTYSDEDRRAMTRICNALATIPGAEPAFAVLEDMVKNEVQTAKLILAWQGATDSLVQAGGKAAMALANFAEGCANLRRLGYTPREIASLLGQIRQAKGTEQAFRFVAGVGENARIASALKGLGRIALVVGVVVRALEAADHFRHGRIGPGMGEVYGTIMSIGVPWAGAVDAVQSIIAAEYPMVAEDPKFNMAFKVLHAINPIGAGKIAVDSIYSVVIAIGNSIASGKADYRTIEELADRMRKSPLNMFTEIGDNVGEVIGGIWGDWLYENVLKDSTWL